VTRTLGRVEEIRRQRLVLATDLDLIYESSFLTAVAEFESLLFELLVEAGSQARVSVGSARSLMRPRSRLAFRTALLQGRQYVDTLPFRRLQDTASLYLKDGGPFDAVSLGDRELLAQAYAIRNAIAHRSEASQSKFEKDCPWVDRLPRNRRRPGPYLQQVVRRSPTIQRRVDIYLTAILSATTAIDSAA